MGLGDASIAEWSAAIMGRIGAPNTGNNESNVGAWYECEQSDADYNIWNTTMACCGGSSVNSAGVMSYPSFSAGVDATVATLLLPAFAGIVAVFKANGSRLALANAVGAAGWGTNPACIDSAASPPGTTKGTATAAGGGQVSDWAPLVKESARRCGNCAKALMAGGLVVAGLDPAFTTPKLVLPVPQDVMWTPGQPWPVDEEET